MEATQSKPSTTSRMHSMAVVFASLFIPLPLLVGRAVEAFMDSTNPDDLTDLRAGLAYLTPILVWTFTVLILVTVAFLVTTIIVAVRAKSFAAVSLPVTIFVIQLVIGIAALIFNGVIDKVDG